jgi:hypothetical protein
MPSADHAQTMAQTLDAYVDGRSGIDFDVLALFAEPLFELYQLDLRNVRSSRSKQIDEEELAGLIAVLDTARLLWSFFSLDDDNARPALERLQTALVGPRPSEDEQLDFHSLLGIMEDQWDAIEPHEREAAMSNSEFVLPPFDQLLADYNAEAIEESAERYGPDGLEAAEALAVFARPLLDEPGVEGDPERLDEAMDRAQAFWDLALAPESERETMLTMILKAFGGHPDTDRAIRAEAERMVRRFFELFPEQQGKT